MPCLRGRGNTSDSVQSAKRYAAAGNLKNNSFYPDLFAKFLTIGLIDPLESLKDKRHYIFHGTQDTFIHFGKKKLEFYFVFHRHLNCFNFSDNGLRVYEFFKTFSPHVKFEQFEAIHSVVRNKIVNYLAKILFLGGFCPAKNHD